MWWCCGKKGIDQPGCRFDKHTDGGDNDEEETEMDKNKNLELKRCMCCREFGHQIDQCMSDPNFLTKWDDVDFDMERINKIKHFKKYHANSMVNTVQFLKKSVMIPITAGNDGRVVEP